VRSCIIKRWNRCLRLSTINQNKTNKQTYQNYPFIFLWTAHHFLSKSILLIKQNNINLCKLSFKICSLKSFIFYFISINNLPIYKEIISLFFLKISFFYANKLKRQNNKVYKAINKKKKIISHFLPNDSKVTPFDANSYLTRLKYVGSGYPKHAVPPEREVLWWIPFHTVWLSRPVVTLRPTVNINFLLNAYLNNSKTYLPSLSSGRYATLLVPANGTPFLTPPFM